jgi:Leucine carboxyl methyltransferase
VLRAKRATLRRAGVCLQASGAPDTTTTAAAAAAAAAASAVVTYDTALRVASWRCAPTDLQRVGWSARLVRAGLSCHQPTAWLAEGLLYYLNPNTVGPMLQARSRCC